MAAYANFRPSYPAKLFQLVFDYHHSTVGNTSGKWGVAVDLGCGTGQATEHLVGAFGQVIGIDKSDGMLRTAREKLERDPHLTSRKTRFSFKKGDAGDLNMLRDESVDLIISAEACHWFDWCKAWREMARILRPGGSMVHWTYAADFVLPDFPTTVPLIKKYASVTLWDYFEHPGRAVLEDMLLEIPDPPKNTGLSKLERRYYCGPNFPPHLPPPRPSQIYPMIMDETMRWRDLLGFLRTWSALHNYLQKFPEDMGRIDERFPEDLVECQVEENAKKRRRSEWQTSGQDGQAQRNVDVSGGDIAIRFWKDLREEVRRSGGKYGINDIVRVEWPVTMLLAKKDAFVRSRL